jgi:hypothetical protein
VLIPYSRKEANKYFISRRKKNVFTFREIWKFEKSKEKYGFRLKFCRRDEWATFLAGKKNILTQKKVLAQSLTLPG